MRALLRHQVLDDDRVLVTLNGAAAHVSAADAKRFAWAVLNDLDPEEAEAAGYQPPAIVLHATDVSGKHHARWPWQLRAILSVLAEQGTQDRLRIASLIECPQATVGVQLSRLKNRGFVEMDRPGKPYSPAPWKITDAGLGYLEQINAWLAERTIGLEAAQ